MQKQLTDKISFAAHAVAAFTSLYCVSVADVVVEAVCAVCATEVDCVVKSSAWHAHPFGAAGKPITPLLADPPVPTLIVNAAVPLLCGMEAPLPNPEAIVGAVPETRTFAPR